jgi:PKD repeat protein
MPDGMDPPPLNPEESSSPEGEESAVPEETTGVPLDGLKPPEATPASEPTAETEPETDSLEEAEDDEPQTAEQTPAAPKQNRKKLLLLIIGGGGAFMLVYLFFAFYLMAALPSPDGTGQGLQLIGNSFYGITILLAIGLIALMGMRLIQGGMDPDEAIRKLIRPGLVVLIMLMIAVMVFFMINRETPLPIDIIEPENLQGLTAPITVTFGTDELRRILRNQNLSVRKYKWDFNGDGAVDADTQDQEVTTVYGSRGNYTVRLMMQLSNGKIRSTARRLVIPNAVFLFEPDMPVLNEPVQLSVENVVTDPKRVEKILWDFQSDGTVDYEAKPDELTISHTFTEVSTHQVEVKIQYQGGLQESYVRPIDVVAEIEQPFEVTLENEGDLKGSSPLGVIFRTSVEEGINVHTIEWQFAKANKAIGGDADNIENGERVTHVFDEPGEYKVILKVTDTKGRIAQKSVSVTALEPLELSDIVITGTPRPNGNKMEGEAPLEVQLSALTTTPFITYKWEQENATRVFSVEETYRALYEDPGTFPIVLIAKDPEERTQKIQLEITVLPPSSLVTFTAVPSTGIAPLNVTFDASQSTVPDGRITGFSWMFGDGDRDEKPQLLGAKVTHRYEEEGTYTAVVRALTEDGRSVEAKKTIVVRLPTLDACIFPSRTTGTSPMGVRFDASCATGNITSYVWNFGDGATSEQTEAQQDHVFEKSGTYLVTLEVTDGQGNFSQATVTIVAE